MSVKMINPPSFGPVLFPYSQGTVANGDMIFIAGQIALDENNQVVAPGDSYEQGKVIIERMRAVLAEAGATLQDVAAATVYYTHVEAAEGFNRAWVEAFGDHLPARAAFLVGLVLEGAVVEVQAMAFKPS
jgi:2-iminobutanoate/2-iminopropanoate deaminase